MFRILGFIMITGANPQPINDSHGPYLRESDCREKLVELYQLAAMMPMTETDGRCERESWLI